jgi:hypothetical protein
MPTVIGQVNRLTGRTCYDGPPHRARYLAHGAFAQRTRVVERAPLGR